jgi:hypothetical protein
LISFLNSSQFGDADDFDPFGEDYDNDRTDDHLLENATKLNYHSYMNNQTRAKWSKSDTQLFYQVFSNQVLQAQSGNYLLNFRFFVMMFLIGSLFFFFIYFDPGSSTIWY